MAKYNFNIGGLTPEENEEINRKVNAGESVTIGDERQEQSGESGEQETVSRIAQTVVQMGTYNYTFDKAPEGLHIGDVYGGKPKSEGIHIGEVFNDED